MKQFKGVIKKKPTLKSSVFSAQQKASKVGTKLASLERRGGNSKAEPVTGHTQSWQF